MSKFEICAMPLGSAAGLETIAGALTAVKSEGKRRVVAQQRSALARVAIGPGPGSAYVAVWSRCSNGEQTVPSTNHIAFQCNQSFVQHARPVEGISESMM